MISLPSIGNGTPPSFEDGYKSLSRQIVNQVKEEGLAVCVLGTPPSSEGPLPLVNVTPFVLVAEFHIDDFTPKRVREWLWQRRKLRAFKKRPLGIWATREMMNPDVVFLGWGSVVLPKVALRLHRRYPQYGPLTYLEPQRAPVTA